MFPGKKILTVTMALALVMAILVAGLGAAETALAAPPIQEAVPQRATIPYAGQLNNAAGQPVADGVYDFTFSLYDAPAGGNLLWTGTQADVAVRGGSFSASLGSGAGLPKIVLDRKDCWLAVGVRGPGETGFTALEPRQLLPTAGPAAVSALSCPHSHFTDYWDGSDSSYGLFVENTSTGDGLRAYSNSGPSADWAAVYARNDATTGSGSGVYGRSNKGAGVYGTSTDGNGVFGKGANGAGGRFEATNNIGLVALTAGPPGAYYGLMVTNGGMRIYGGCTGCTIAYTGLNSGAAAIHPGDLVAAAGVEMDATTGEPILLVRLASQPNDAVIGVAIGAAASPSETQRTGKKAPDKTDCTVIASGEYLDVIVAGLTQVRVGDTKIAIGEHLAPGRDGAIAATDAAGSVARVLSAPDADGLAWAMVNAR